MSCQPKTRLGQQGVLPLLVNDPPGASQKSLGCRALSNFDLIIGADSNFKSKEDLEASSLNHT